MPATAPKMNNKPLSKEEILLEALPYIQRYEGKTFVVKYGGAAMTDTAVRDSIARDLTLLQKIGIRIVLVHGGGPAITELEEKLGIESTFINGLRYTTEQTLRSVLMSLAGMTNKEIVHQLITSGANALGLSGIDAGLLKAKRMLVSGNDLGYVGDIISVNTTILTDLLEKKVIPVVAPVASGEENELLNVNADSAAAAIAAALSAEKLFFISDTHGVMSNGEVIPTLTRSRAEQYIQQGIIKGGMIPKVQSCFTALEAGVKKIHIIAGESHSMLLEIFTNEGVGTQIINDEYPIEAAKESTSTSAKSLLDFSSLTEDSIYSLFELADYLQKHPETKPLAGKSIAVLFQKPSLRTRVSFEVGIAELGGTPVVLGDEAVGLGKREPVSDVGRVLERYCDAIIARVYEHSILEEFAASTSVPIVNALSDLLHPCQILADVYTLYQHGWLNKSSRLKVAYVGDANNVSNSWIELARILPIDLRIACPKGYEPDSAFLKYHTMNAKGTVSVTNDPAVAVAAAEVIYTDVWTSMGQEKEYQERLAAFKGFQVTKAMLSVAAPNYAVMHCLPAHRGEEIASDVLESSHSIVFDQAENRLHIQKAVLAWLFSPAASSNYQSNQYEQTTQTVSHKGDHLA